MAAQDPDAIWKPGYTGEIVYPSAVAPAAHPTNLRWLAPVVISVVVVTTVVVLVVTRLTGDRDAADSSAIDRIPTQVRERWTATLDGPVGAVTGTADVIVADAGRELIALDADSGTELWRVPVPAETDGGELEVIDGVVVSYTISDGEQSLTGFDLHDGHQMWAETLPEGPEVSLAGEELIVPRFSAAGMLNSAEFLDPRTGARLAAFEGEEVTMSSTAIRRRVDDVVEWYDRETFERRARVDLATLGLDRFRTAGAPTDAGLVIATFDRAWLLDNDGAVVSSVEFSSKLGAPWNLDELDGSGRYLVLEGVDATTVLTVRDGKLEELWTRPVAPIRWMIDYSRTVLTIRELSDPGAGLQVVDAASGRSIFAGQDGGLWEPNVTRNGFIAGTAPSEDGSWSVAGYDFEGTELWRLPVPESGWPFLLPGALVTVYYDTDARETTLTLLS